MMMLKILLSLVVSDHRLRKVFLIHEFLQILNSHRVLKIKLAVMSYIMKFENFLDLQSYKQN